MTDEEGILVKTIKGSDVQDTGLKSSASPSSEARKEHGSRKGKSILPERVAIATTAATGHSLRTYAQEGNG